jgi:ketosteroid isomerase-like protein
MRAAPPLLGSNDERAVWKAQTDLQRAFLRGDTAAYGRLTSDEFFRVAPNAEPQGKSDFLRVVKENAGQHAGKLETGDVQITVAGDTARVVMNIWGTLPNGNPVPPTRVTRVFARRSGQWQQAAAIFTPLAQQ